MYKENQGLQPRAAEQWSYDQIIKIINKNMTQLNLERSLRAQLESLNDTIDRKIVRGVSYAREAREHKQVLTRLANLRRNRNTWSFRSLSLA